MRPMLVGPDHVSVELSLRLGQAKRHDSAPATLVVQERQQRSMLAITLWLPTAAQRSFAESVAFRARWSPVGLGNGRP